MYLRDFSIDSRIKNQQYLMYDDNHRKCFSREALVIIEAVIFLLKTHKIKTKDTVKICVEPDEKTKTWKNLHGRVLCPFLFQKFLTSEKQTREMMLIDFVREVFNYVASECGWDEEPIANIISEIRKNPCPVYQFKKNKLSPDKKRTAGVFYQYTPDSFDIYVQVNNRKGERLGRKKVHSRRPFEGVHLSCIKDFRWKWKNKIGIIAPKWGREKNITCDVSEFV